ncbi:MAG: nitrile hydratase subunit beta [Rhodospirillales bacterium]|nr:nitrile hydratase subunit beta [Rhodospirillales bacterium]
MTEEPYRPHHDLAGREAGEIERHEHALAHWEKQVDAMLILLADPQRGAMRVDELRRGIESLPPDAYDRMSYYERWIESIRTVMVEKGIVTEDEIAARIAALRETAS